MIWKGVLVKRHDDFTKHAPSQNVEWNLIESMEDFVQVFFNKEES
jgi:hypothetical protein